MTDFQTWLLIKSAALIVITIALTVTLTYVTIMLHLWYKQIKRIDSALDWLQSIVGEFSSSLKTTLANISHSLGNFNEIASWVWQWYEQQQREPIVMTKPPAKSKTKTKTKSKSTTKKSSSKK